MLTLPWLERERGSNYQRSSSGNLVPIGNPSIMDIFLRFSLSIMVILVPISLTVQADLEMGFMKKLLNKCSRKLRSFEQASGSSDVMERKTKLLAKAIPPTNLQGM